MRFLDHIRRLPSEVSWPYPISDVYRVRTGGDFRLLLNDSSPPVVIVLLLPREDILRMVIDIGQCAAKLHFLVQCFFLTWYPIKRLSVSETVCEGRGATEICIILWRFTPTV